MMRRLLRTMHQQMNRHSLAILTVGCGVVAWYGRRQAQRERLLMADVMEPVHRQSVESWPARPMVSVLVAAWNEATNIEQLLSSFEALSYPDVELILCAGGSDQTYALAERVAGPNVTLLRQLPGEGKQCSLQRCLSRARGTIIYLTDADCRLSGDAFLRLVEPLAAGRAQIVTGVSEPKTPQRGNPLVQYQWFGDLVWSRRMPDTVDGVLGRNCALLRSVLEDVGGFDTPVPTGTDYFLSRLLTRAGYVIHSVRDSRIETDYPESPRSYLRMWRRWNKNLLIHGLRLGRWGDVRGILTAAGLYGLILGLPVLTLVAGPAALALWMMLLVKANVNRYGRLSAGAQLAGSTITWRNVVSLPFYTCLDMLAVLLAVRDAVDPRLRSRW